MDSVTRNILDIFTRISGIPRQSKHEEKISRWLTEWAQDHELDFKRDHAGNVVIEVPGTAGRDSAATVVIQGHMDMVCEKTPDSSHDFSKDGIELLYDGDWLSARKTTLGADNGIAIAMALALVSSRGIEHPPLELLFTVDEETGLTGANALENDFLTGRLLINLDSEDERDITIGCAGGNNSLISFSLDREKIDPAYTGIFISVGGLTGGHSGADIHRHRGNANKLLSRILDGSIESGRGRIVSLSGGSARNAIPRDATATLVVNGNVALEQIEELKKKSVDIKREHRGTEPGLNIGIKPAPLDGKTACTVDLSKRIIRLIRALPDGVQEHSPQIPDLVETSCNVATIRETGDQLEICTSLRSSVMSSLHDLTRVFGSVASLAGVSQRIENEYVAWAPDADSPLLALAKTAYKKALSREAGIRAIHAGLECAVIGAKFKGMDMISLGPTIEHPHSPDERIFIPSILNVWKALLSLLQSLSGAHA